MTQCRTVITNRRTGSNKLIQLKKKRISVHVDQGLSKVWYQGVLKATVSGVYEDLMFKISKDSNQN